MRDASGRENISHSEGEALLGHVGLYRVSSVSGAGDLCAHIAATLFEGHRGALEAMAISGTLVVEDKMAKLLVLGENAAGGVGGGTVLRRLVSGLEKEVWFLV